MKRSVLKSYRAGPKARRISVWCPVCEEVYGIADAPGELSARRCPYGHAGLSRSWIARIVEGLR